MVSKPNPKLKSKKESRQTEEETAESSLTKAEPQEKKSVIKEKTPEEKAKEHREGIIKTVVAAALGIIAGFLIHAFYGIGENKVWYATLFIVIGITYFLQKYLIFPQLKIDAKELKLKDWFYVEFIIIDLFLVVWTLLLN